MYREFLSKNFGYAHLRGFDYLARACELYPEGIKMQAVYAVIAREFHVSAYCVERNIRSYVSHLKKGGGVDALKCKIHNFSCKEVIAAIVLTVRKEADHD